LIRKETKNTKEIQDDSVSANLYNNAQSQIKRLVISEEDTSEVYAVIENTDHIETLNLSSSKATLWLRMVDQYDGRLNKIQTAQVCKNVLETIKAEALMGNAKKKKIHLRTAFEDDVLYYDLAGSDWSLVKLDGSDIDLIPMTQETPLFRRAQSSYEQVEPTFDDQEALDKYTQLLKIKEEQIFKVHLCSLFLPHIPIPMMDFVGEAGSMKSTISAYIKRIVDPSGSSKEDNLSSMPTKLSDLAIHLYQRYLPAFDNVSKITKMQSDLMCIAITGGNIPKRTLYTNKDETILSYRRKLIINGIAPTLSYPDLLDRTIFYERKLVDENNRLTDEEVRERFEELLPLILGNVFTVLQKAIKIRKEIQKQIKKKTRNADFEVWGEAISRALGYEPNTFLENYYALIRQQTITQIDSQPLGMTIERLLDKERNWDGSTTELFKVLKGIGDLELGIEVNSPHENFPKSSSVLSGELTNLSPILKKRGIKVEHYTYTKHDSKYSQNTSMYHLSKVTGEDGEGNFSS